MSPAPDRQVGDPPTMDDAQYAYDRAVSYAEDASLQAARLTGDSTLADACCAQAWASVGELAMSLACWAEADR